MLVVVVATILAVEEDFGGRPEGGAAASERTIPTCRSVTTGWKVMATRRFLVSIGRFHDMIHLIEVGYNVAPFGPDTTASPGPSRGPGRGRGEFTPRGSGRGGGRGGRGGRGGATAGESPYGSGSATPVTGLGYRRDDKHHGKHPRHGLGSTVGKGIGSGDVIWGGRGAPLFVKAGELFKDGEVDVITLDQGGFFVLRPGRADLHR